MVPTLCKGRLAPGFSAKVMSQLKPSQERDLIIYFAKEWPR